MKNPLGVSLKGHQGTRHEAKKKSLDLPFRSLIPLNALWVFHGFHFCRNLSLDAPETVVALDVESWV